METKFSTASEIGVEINGRPLLAVESYRSSAVREIRAVEAFGQTGAAGIAAGNPRYQVEITRVRQVGEIDFYGLADFSVVIGRPQSRAIYTGCEWEAVEEKAEASGAVTETIRMTALSRMELPA